MKVLETVEFQLKDGVDEAQFLIANQQISHWLAELRGFESRIIARNQDGWIDCTLWADDACATEAKHAFMAEMCTTDFIRMIDEASVTMHYRAVVG